MAITGLLDLREVALLGVTRSLLGSPSAAVATLLTCGCYKSVAVAGMANSNGMMLDLGGLYSILGFFSPLLDF